MAKNAYSLVRDAMTPTIKGTSTRNLCVMLAELDRPNLAEHERLVAGVLSDEIYERHPEVRAASDAWIDAADDERTLTRVILDTASTCT